MVETEGWGVDPFESKLDSHHMQAAASASKQSIRPFSGDHLCILTQQSIHKSLTHVHMCDWEGEWAGSGTGQTPWHNRRRQMGGQGGGNKDWVWNQFSTVPQTLPLGAGVTCSKYLTRQRVETKAGVNWKWEQGGRGQRGPIREQRWSVCACVLIEGTGCIHALRRVIK